MKRKKKKNITNVNDAELKANIPHAKLYITRNILKQGLTLLLTSTILNVCAKIVITKSITNCKKKFFQKNFPRNGSTPGVKNRTYLKRMDNGVQGRQFVLARTHEKFL